MGGRDVCVVGGGNSAGQAALHLASHAASVTMLVRGDSLARTMSEYLVSEIENAPNIAVRTRTAIMDGGGRGRLESLTIRDAGRGSVETLPAAAVFLLIGAEPRTEWLQDTVARDDSGYVITGYELASSDRLPAPWPLQRPPYLLETSVPGVFAAGDVRSRSTKRVASAVGEGAIAIRLVHEYLEDTPR
jgi:thioredoxin reductase (NADPH)